MTSTGRPAPAWYPDPLGRHQHRYWDGEQWTIHVADNGVAAIEGAGQQPAPQPAAVEQPVVEQPVVEETRPATPTWQPVVEEPRPPMTTWQPASTSSYSWQSSSPSSSGWEGATTPVPARSSSARVWVLVIAFVVAIAGVGVTAFLALGRSDGTDTLTASGDHKYPASVEADFMAGCTSKGGTTNYCRCALTHIEQDNDLTDLAGMAQEYKSTGKFPDSLVQAARDCISEQFPR